MPQNPNPVAPSTTYVDMTNAPGGDQDWDSLFPNPENPAASTPQVSPGTNPQQPPQAANDWFLRSTDGKIVYRTAEDAIAGVSHKDAEIERLRGFLKSTGVDPNTLQTSQPQATPAPESKTNSPYKYYGNPNTFDEIAAAATARDKQKYTQIFDAYMKEAIQANLEPWRPTLAETNRNKAMRQVQQQIRDFDNFYFGDGHKQVLESNPLFREMEQIGENDPIAAQRLQEVYQAEYLMWKGMQPQTPQTPQATPQVTSPTVRSQPTLQPSALTPPAPTPVYAQNAWAQPLSNRLDRSSNEARKQLIADGDAKFGNQTFDQLGY